MEATDRTGNPNPSASAIDTADGVVRTIRALTAEAPAACNDTPCQENGTNIDPSAVSALARITACSAASSITGWTPNPATDTPASSGSATSANTSSPRRHIAVKPRNAGPYPYPRSANRSYPSPTSTATAPTGGHTDRSEAGGTEPT